MVRRLMPAIMLVEENETGKVLRPFLSYLMDCAVYSKIARPLRIEYPGACYHFHRKLRCRIEKIREMISPTSIQKKT